MSDGTVENAIGTSTEDWDPPKKCPGNNTKSKDVEVPVRELWGMWTSVV